MAEDLDQSEPRLYDRKRHQGSHQADQLTPPELEVGDRYRQKQEIGQHVLGDCERAQARPARVPHDRSGYHREEQQTERQRERDRHPQRAPPAHHVETHRHHSERDQRVQRRHALVGVVQVRCEMQEPERGALAEDGKPNHEAHHQHRPAHEDH